MNIKILKMLKPMIPQLVLLAVIYIVLLTLPYRNIISINLAIIIPLLMYKIYVREKPVLKTWIKTILVTVAWTTGLILIYKLLGGLGIIGGIIIILVIVALRIKKGWKLYSYTTKWGADYLRGNKKDFDVQQLNINNQLNNNQEKKG